MNQNIPVSFNPITNQPLKDYTIQEKKNEQEIQNLNNLNNQMDQLDIKERYKEMQRNQREQIPVEYNPYKQPYLPYQGHP